MALITINKARAIIEVQEPISISFWKENGDIVHADNVVCTSSYFHGNTFNFKWLSSDEFRKVKAWNIFEVNGQEVCL